MVCWWGFEGSESLGMLLWESWVQLCFESKKGDRFGKLTSRIGVVLGSEHPLSWDF